MMQNTKMTRFRLRTGMLLIVLLGLIIYFNSLQNDFITGDDEDQIINNRQVHSWKNIPAHFVGSTYFREENDTAYGLYYRPLMQTVYSLIYNAVGPDPLYFHLTQLLLHIGNALLVFLLFKQFGKIVWAFLAALIFLVHPLNSEAVLHIANMQENLFFFFGSLALIILTQSPNPKLTLNRALGIGTGLLFSLLAKETGGLFLLIAVWYVFLLQRKMLPQILTVVGVTGGIYGFMRGLAGIGWGSDSIAPINHVSLGVRLLTIPRIIWEYLYKFIFPQQLSLAQFWVVQRVTFTDFVLPLIGVGLVMWGLWYGRKELGRGITPDKKGAYSFFLLWFWLGLLVHIQLIPLDATWAERWFYFPLVGLLGCLVLIMTEVRIRRRYLIISASLILLLALRTLVRSFDWYDSKTLLTHDIALTQGNYYLENMLGALYIQDKNYAAAGPYIESSVAAYPYFGNLTNLGIIYLKQKNYPQAKIYFEKALEARGNYATYQNYANFLLYILKDYQAAHDFTEKSVVRYPKAGLMWLVLAQAQYYLGEKDQALASSWTAFTLKPFDMTYDVYLTIREGGILDTEKYLRQE